MLKSGIIHAFLILVTLSSTIYGQDTKIVNYFPVTKHPNWFKTIPPVDSNTPDWVLLMYQDSENFIAIEEAHKAFYKENSFEKTIHTQNYKYWMRSVRNWVNESGKIDMPAPGQNFKKYEKQKSINNLNKSRSANTWENIGPNITYLSNGSGSTRPTQANVYCLGVSPSNHDVVYAGMETGGIFKSIDKGLSWDPVSYGYAIGNLQDIKVDPLNSDIVYAAQDKEIYKTEDGGTTWSQIYVAAERIEQFLIHSLDSDTLYAATQDGLLKSEDAGSTWTNKYAGYIFDIEAKPGTNDTLYISVKNDVFIRPEIFKSVDSGDTWELMDTGFYTPSVIDEAVVYGCKIGVTPADPNRIYAGIIASGKAADNGWIGVYYSLDEGATWQEDSGFDGAPYASGNDSSTNWYVGGYSSGYHQGWYNFDLDISHNDPDKIWIGTIWFCESGNKGGNIEYIRGTRSLEMHADIQDIDVVGDDIWIASDGGINFSDDECATVEVRMDGIIASDFWGFGHGWNTDCWVGGRYHNGNAAFHENYGIGNTIFLGGAETGTGYVNQLDNYKTYFSDIGDKRIPGSITLPAENIPNLGLYPTESYFHFSYSEVEWHPTHANQVYIGKDDKLYKSTDGGSTFDVLSTLPAEIKRFEISRDDPNYIYAIVYHSYWDWRVYKSIDAGLNFTEISKPSITGGSWRNLSFSLNPFDKNEIWLASNSSSNGNKIFSSINGGDNWTNHYTATIADQAIKDLIYHKSTAGDKVYAMTNDNFFYFDIDTQTWTQYNDGLPVEHRGFMILPFYRDSKIRMASARGIWEIPFETESEVQVIPMLNSDSLYCERDTVQFECHSIVDHQNATWKWTISPTPVYIENANIRNPKVVLGNEGSYNATLEITKDGSVYTKTTDSIINLENQCESDTIAGQVLRTYSNGDYAVAQEANLTDVTHFTVSGWWKPAGEQQGFAALFSSGDWCAHCDYTEGLIVDYWGSRLWYKWPGNVDNWGSNSGMTIPLDEWSYVAMVIEPSKATLYLNDDKYVHNINLDPADISTFYLGYGHYSKSFKGDIDEVAIWDRALSEDEIKLLRHLTKEVEIASDPNLIAYYQFNELLAGTNILDMAGVTHATLHNDAELMKSTAPIGKGVSAKMIVDSGGIKDFDPTGLEMEFPATGNYPDGDIVVSRLDVLPDTIPGVASVAQSYWVINNYGPNKIFNALLSLKVEGAGDLSAFSVPESFSLNQRGENAFGANWINLDTADDLDNQNGILTFDTGLNLTSSGQIIIDNPSAFSWIGLVSTDWNNPGNWSGGNLPDENSEVIIPLGTPFYPIVNSNSKIRTLCVLKGAVFMVETGVEFEVTGI